MMLLGCVAAVTTAPQEEQVVAPTFKTAPQRWQFDAIAFHPPWISHHDCATETIAAQLWHRRAARCHLRGPETAAQLTRGCGRAGSRHWRACRIRGCACELSARTIGASAPAVRLRQKPALETIARRSVNPTL